MADTKITVNKNGPFRIEGDNIQILDPTGKAYGLGGRTALAYGREIENAGTVFWNGPMGAFEMEPYAAA